MDFFKERNLWQIYRESRVIPISNINKYITLLVLLIAILNGITLSTSELYEVIKSTSGSLFGVILTTLGFSGWVCNFCTVLPLELQKQMMDAIDKETNLTYIKNSILFLRVFFIL